jgi:translation initiation factor IF-3
MTIPANEKIKADKVQLIDHLGVNRGVLSRDMALKEAQAAGLDLVLLSDSGAEGVPVVKIMDVGKAFYLKKKKASTAKKNQTVIKIKEIKLRPKIGEHDYQTKLKQGIQFLKDGMRLKVTLMFKGRENSQKEELGRELFDKVDLDLKEVGFANLLTEPDAKSGSFWSRIYFVKSK